VNRNVHYYMHGIKEFIYVSINGVVPTMDYARGHSFLGDVGGEKRVVSIEDNL